MTITRRQFVGGAAVAAGAAALPAVMSAAPAIATPALALPIAHSPWIPLDPKKAARVGWEVYKGVHAPQAA